MKSAQYAYMRVGTAGVWQRLGRFSPGLLWGEKTQPDLFLLLPKKKQKTKNLSVESRRVR